MYERDLKQEVQDPLQNRISVKKKNPYLRDPLYFFMYSVLHKPKHRDRHEHKGIKRNQCSCGALSSVHLVES